MPSGETIKYVSSFLLAVNRKKREGKEFVRFRLDLGRLFIDARSTDSSACLKEIRHIIDKLHQGMFLGYGDDEIDYDHPLSFFSDAAVHSKVSPILDKLSQIYSGWRTSRVVLENKKIVELEKGRVQNQLDVSEIDRGVKRLFFHIPREHVKHVLVHVKGHIAEEETHKVVDHIARELGSSVEVNHVCTQSDVASHTIVECVFFGEFHSENTED